MKEVYADFNDLADDGSPPLTCNGSIASIAAQREPLSEGEEIWLADAS